ncbi:MAG TPA: hypothetical protein VGI81_26490 [Tepidisphaeraceae bacterium]|jgi:pimeloyl-ACP methyl ester carboxylesterase
MAIRQPKDSGPKAATYLTVLGWVNLMGLSLGGLIWLWFAWNVRARSDGFRKAAVVLLGLHVLVAGLIPLKLLLMPGDPPKLRAFGDVLPIGPVIIVLSAAAFGAVFLIPMLWLLAPGTRAAFERRVERRLCVKCGYDLRASKDRCPECGTPIP